MWIFRKHGGTPVDLACFTGRSSMTWMIRDTPRGIFGDVSLYFTVVFTQFTIFPYVSHNVFTMYFIQPIYNLYALYYSWVYEPPAFTGISVWCQHRSKDARLATLETAFQRRLRSAALPRWFFSRGALPWGVTNEAFLKWVTPHFLMLCSGNPA